MLMSKAEYAKHRGVSRQTVYSWIERGEVVMSGNKIDATATELQRQTSEPTEKAATDDRWAHRTLEMTWPEFWAAVKAQDGKVPAPTNDEELESRVLGAADELNWQVEFLDNGGIYLDDGDTEYYFQQYGFRENAWLAIEKIRREVCYIVNDIRGDKTEKEINDWSPAGIKALAKWSRPS